MYKNWLIKARSTLVVAQAENCLVEHRNSFNSFFVRSILNMFEKKI